MHTEWIQTVQILYHIIDSGFDAILILLIWFKVAHIKLSSAHSVEEKLYVF